MKSRFAARLPLDPGSPSADAAVVRERGRAFSECPRTAATVSVSWTVCGVTGCCSRPGHGSQAAVQVFLPPSPVSETPPPSWNALDRATPCHPRGRILLSPPVGRAVRVRGSPVVQASRGTLSPSEGTRSHASCICDLLLRLMNVPWMSAKTVISDSVSAPRRFGWAGDTEICFFKLQLDIASGLE